MDKAIYADCLRRVLSCLRSIDIGSRSRIHKSVLLVTAALLAIAMLLALSHWSTANTPAYRLAAVKRGSIVSTVTASGTLNPVTTVIVGSQLSGQIVEILAGYNDRVSSGQILARLNSDQIRFRRDAAQADLAQARAMKSMQEAKVSEAQLAFERQAKLPPSGAVSEASYDTARTTFEAAKAQLQVAAAKVDQVTAMLHQVEVDLNNTDIRSPVDGVIVQRSVELGQTVAASLQSPTIFTIADDLRRMEIAVSVDETDVGRVRPGQKVTFTVSAYPGREFDGRVKQIRLGSQTVSNVVTYTGIVSIANPNMELLPGMTASVKIETDARVDVLLVPKAALRWKPAGATASAPAVYIPGPDGEPRLVPVRLGAADANASEISPAQPVREVIIGRSQ
jgi:HlyD family secretion protein